MKSSIASGQFDANIGKKFSYVRKLGVIFL
jgi:hypothetical protein